jgi:hypothetical protein
MPATTVLPLTSLLYAISPNMDSVVLSTTASTTSDAGVVTSVVTASNITVGTGLFVEQELMKVIEILSDQIGVKYRVKRGQGGSQAQIHNSMSPVTIGRMSDFYSYDPKGRPRDAVLVSPWINTVNGRIWLPQGDSSPAAPIATIRWWQDVTNTYGYGPLGVRTVVSSPTYGT